MAAAQKEQAMAASLVSKPWCITFTDSGCWSLTSFTQQRIVHVMFAPCLRFQDKKLISIQLMFHAHCSLANPPPFWTWTCAVFKFKYLWKPCPQFSLWIWEIVWYCIRVCCILFCCVCNGMSTQLIPRQKLWTLSCLFHPCPKAHPFDAILEYCRGFFVWFLHRPQIQSLIRAILQRADGVSILPGFVIVLWLRFVSLECLNQIEMLRLCLKMGWTLITNDTGSCLVTAGTLTVKMQHHIYTYTIGWHRMQHAYMHTYI